MVGPRFGAEPVRQTLLDNFAAPSQNFFYGFVSHTDGPEGQDAENMDAPCSEGQVSHFDSVVPRGVNLKLARLNIGIVDENPRVTRFGGIPKPANGVLFHIVDPDKNIVKDLTAGHPIRQNADFGFLAGDDVDFLESPGPDLVKVRWSLWKSGGEMLLPSGYAVRITIQDDLSDVNEFRIMSQGLLVPA